MNPPHWKKLSFDKRKFFREYLSTGCGPDDWPRGDSKLKKDLDTWFECGACDQHDWEDFCGYKNKFEFARSNIVFLKNAVVLACKAIKTEHIFEVIKRIIAAVTAYIVIVRYHKPNLVSVYQGEAELDLIIEEYFLAVNTNKDYPSSPIEWMQWLENQKIQ